MAPAFSTLSSTARCSICLEDVSDGCNRTVTRLQCSHEFHLDCIGSAFNACGAMQCPNCRNVEVGDWRRFRNAVDQETVNRILEMFLQLLQQRFNNYYYPLHGFQARENLQPGHEETRQQLTIYASNSNANLTRYRPYSRPPYQLARNHNLMHNPMNGQIGHAHRNGVPAVQVLNGRTGPVRHQGRQSLGQRVVLDHRHGAQSGSGGSANGSSGPIFNNFQRMQQLRNNQPSPAVRHMMEAHQNNSLQDDWFPGVPAAGTPLAVPALPSTDEAFNIMPSITISSHNTMQIPDFGNRETPEGNESQSPEFYYEFVSDDMAYFGEHEE